MKTNIFEKAKFGDKYMTKDCRIAKFICITKITENERYCLFVEGEQVPIWYDEKGNSLLNKDKLAIVSSCKSFNSQKLDEIAESMSKGFWSDDLEAFEDNPQRSLIMWTAKRIYEAGIKNGYRKAMEL